METADEGPSGDVMAYSNSSVYDSHSHIVHEYSHISQPEEEQGAAAESSQQEVDLSDVPILSWSHPTFTGKAPPARGGHTASLVGNLLVLFGGHYFGDGGKFQYCNDVWAVDIDTMTWHNPKCAGRGPGPRYGHSATVIDYKIYIFGGKGPNKMLYNDLWCLDVENWAWSLLPSASAPPVERFNHAATSVGSKIAIFGGWDGNTCYNDFWVYSVAARSWMKPKLGGPKPTPRQGHSMIMTDDGRILVFGGWAFTEGGWPEYRSELRQLDMHQMAWTRPKVTGEYPTGRFLHGCVQAGPFMIIFGGYGGTRPKPPPAAAKAAQRGMTSEMSSKRDIQKVPETLNPDELPPPVGIAVADSGEEIPIGKHPDVWILDTRLNMSGTDGNMVWSQPLIAGQPVDRRYGHSFTAVGADLVALCGWNGSKSLNDAVQLNVSSLLETGESEGDGDNQRAATGDNQ